MPTRRQRNPELFKRLVLSPLPLREEPEVVVTLQFVEDVTPLPANRRSTLSYGERPCVTLDRVAQGRSRLRWRPTA